MNIAVGEKQRIDTIGRLANPIGQFDETIWPIDDPIGESNKLANGHNQHSQGQRPWSAMPPNRNHTNPIWPKAIINN